MTVDRKVNNSGLQINSGITTIKFFPTAHHAQSKSVAVASIADIHTHATPTHLLSQLLDIKSHLSIKYYINTLMTY